MYPEVHLPPEQMKAWMADKQGAVIGVDLARRFNWKLGDRIPLKSFYRLKNGADTWEFNIVGMPPSPIRASTTYGPICSPGWGLTDLTRRILQRGD